MKKLVIIAALVALAGCSQQAEKKPKGDPADATAIVATESTPLLGDFDVTMAGGTKAKSTINADGTYVDTGPDGKQVKGKFARKDGEDCFDPDGNEAEVCWISTSPAADGSFTATGPDGTTVTVTPAKK